MCGLIGEPERLLYHYPINGNGSELCRRCYDRFGLFSQEVGDSRQQDVSALPCMHVGVPADSNASQSDHSHCWCNLAELLDSDWDADGRRDIMGEAIDELEQLRAVITEAGQAPANYRLLVSFDS